MSQRPTAFRRRTRGPGHSTPYRPRLELLEDRFLPSHTPTTPVPVMLLKDLAVRTVATDLVTPTGLAVLNRNELLEGPLEGHSLDDLYAELLRGNIYVNVHTNDGVGEPNTGPGDFPGGEIRGQLRANRF